jgi:peptidyl-prolyl cis-trans isomerase D
MLRKMRENASSWIIKVLLGVIVVVFVLMGTGGQDNNNSGKVVTVNGESILYGEYRSEYFNMLEQYRKSFGIIWMTSS